MNKYVSAIGAAALGALVASPVGAAQQTLQEKVECVREFYNARSKNGKLPVILNDKDFQTYKSKGIDWYRENQDNLETVTIGFFSRESAFMMEYQNPKKKIRLFSSDLIGSGYHYGFQKVDVPKNKKDSPDYFVFTHVDQGKLKRITHISRKPAPEKDRAFVDQKYTKIIDRMLNVFKNRYKHTCKTK